MGIEPIDREPDGGAPILDAHFALLAAVPPHLREAARLGLTELHPPFTMDKTRCIECGLCREVCPFTAVMLVPTRWKIQFEVDLARCRGCGGPGKAPCVRYCPSPGALVQIEAQ